MNKMTDKPKNMTRVMVLQGDIDTLLFAYYKDGLYEIEGEAHWSLPHLFDGWISISELKFKIGL